jgi:hypothetical protein
VHRLRQVRLRLHDGGPRAAIPRPGRRTFAELAAGRDPRAAST